MHKEPKRDAPEVASQWAVREHTAVMINRAKAAAGLLLLYAIEAFLLQRELVCFQKWKGHVLAMFRYWRKCLMLREWCWNRHAGIQFDCFFSSKLSIYCMCIIILPVEFEAEKSLHCVVSEFIYSPTYIYKRLSICIFGNKCKIYYFVLISDYKSVVLYCTSIFLFDYILCGASWE